MKKVIVFLVVIVALSEARKPVPTYIKTCNRNDPGLRECFAKNANLAMSYIAQGDKDYNIKTLLPMKWRDLLIVDMPPLKLMLIDIFVHGAANMTIVDPIIDLDKKIIQFTFLNPLIIWDSKFVAIVEENGIKIHTDGHAKIHFQNGKYAMLFEYELQEVNGIEYANITKYDTDFLGVDLTFKLDNLDANPIIRGEWEKVQEHFINEQVTRACGQIVGEYINRILTVVPFSEIFPDE